MPTLTLPELLDRIEKGSDRVCLFPSERYRHARQFPEQYEIVSRTQREEIREVGPCDIPRQGSLITLVDRDNYIEDDEEYKAEFERRFPELVAEEGREAFIAEVFDDFDIDYVPAESDLSGLCAIGPGSSEPPTQFAPPKKAKAFVNMTIDRYVVRKKAETKAPS
jgi:hypothetical protein